MIDEAQKALEEAEALKKVLLIFLFVFVFVNNFFVNP